MSRSRWACADCVSGLRDPSCLAAEPATRVPHRRCRCVPHRRPERGDHRAAGTAEDIPLRPQTFRSFCNVPVAVMPSGQKTQFAPHLRSGHLDADALRSLSHEWAAQHRQLFIVAASTRDDQRPVSCDSDSSVPTAVNAHFLVQTLVTLSRRLSPAAALVRDRPGSVAADAARGARDGRHLQVILNPFRGEVCVYVRFRPGGARLARAIQLPSCRWG